MTGNPKLQRDETPNLEQRYAKSLADYLARGDEHSLRNAYEIGRAAMADARGVLEMAALHHTAMAKVLEGVDDAPSLKQAFERAKEFFGESLSPYEMAHRGYREAVSALRKLNETLEQEIQRIAQAVHDEAGQLLVAARLAMSEVAHDLNPGLKGRLQEIGTILDQVEQQLRRLSHELRPTILDDLGLVPALQFLADSFSRRSELSVRVEGSSEGRYAPSIETAVYRVVQEALTNVARHAQARNVRIQLTHDAEALHCLVHDDGTGFDVRTALSRKGTGGLGLAGIRERLSAVGGTLQINSKPGQGTELLIRILMEKKHANSSGSRR